MNTLRNIWPAYLTAFVIALAAAAGFVGGVIVHNGMALDAIAKLNHATNAAILERGA